MPLQHLELANFCLDYLLSPHLAIKASDEEIEQRAKDEYFAFHDYTSVHWFDHIMFVAGDCAESDNETGKKLIVK